MTSFALKIIALISMLFDHFGDAFFKHFSYMNLIGRFAFPIFAFQISEGFIHTKNIKKYFIRLGLFAIISQIPFMLFCSIFSNSIGLNVIFTLFFGLVSIIAYDKCNKFFGIIIAIILGISAQILNCDYGFYGVAITFLFYVCNKNKLLLAFSFVVATVIRYTFDVLKYHEYGIDILKFAFNYYLPYCICTLLSVFFIILYNKKKGPNVKYLLYLFYPLHMLLVYGINLVLQS